MSNTILSKQAYTDNGNKYNKSKVGITVCGLYGTAKVAKNIFQFKDVYKASADAFVSQSGVSRLTARSSVVLGLAFGAAIAIGTLVGVGAIIDGIVNTVRRNNADKQAKTLNQKI
ncbi:MAG: hypothetical protein E7Z90_06015 [Cyanobacteria bacterium SIG29]|nr:hypothetical protein [Cyanobacteria bacterium SIG29]